MRLNEEELNAYGQRLGAELGPGAVVALTGELGAGKTTFAKAIAAGLGVEEAVTSPTFTLINEYTSGRLPLYHFDVYRLGEAQGDDANEPSATISAKEEFIEIGFEEYIFGEGVTVIEWADRVADMLPEYAVWIKLSHTDDPGARDCEQLGAPEHKGTDLLCRTVLRPTCEHKGTGTQGDVPLVSSAKAAVFLGVFAPSRKTEGVPGNVLAIETTGPICSVALRAEDGRVFSRKGTEGLMHLTSLLPMIEDVLKEAGVKPGELERIAASAGPGSFTGIRIGVATVRALAKTLDIPVVKVPTLETFVYLADVRLPDADPAEIWQTGVNQAAVILPNVDPAEARQTGVDHAAATMPDADPTEVWQTGVGQAAATLPDADPTEVWQTGVNQAAVILPDVDPAEARQTGVDQAAATMPDADSTESIPLTEDIQAGQSRPFTVVCPVFDARRDQVYAGAYMLEEDGRIMTLVNGGAYEPDEYLAALDASRAALERLALRVRGPGAAITCLPMGDGVPVLYGRRGAVDTGAAEQEHAEATQKVRPPVFGPPVSGPPVGVVQDALAVLAWAMEHGEPVSCERLEPIYMRKAEAQRKLDEAQRKAEVQHKTETQDGGDNPAAPCLVRPATGKDVYGMSVIERLSFGEPWLENSILGDLELEYSDYVVCENDGFILGYAGLHRILEEGHITNIAVHPSVRQRGVGSAALAELMRRAGEEGIGSFTLEVRAEDEAAINFYEKHGFRTEGVRKGYYPAATGREDALIMWHHTEGI